MPATIMDGRVLAARIRAQVAEDATALGDVGLATVLVGDDPASETYIRLKHAAAIEAGIRALTSGFRPRCPRTSCWRGSRS